MNSSDHTPVKSTFLSENADAIMRLTPQHDVDRSDEELLDTFSAMKVTFHSKRFADNDTIEGSPVNLNRFKRIDLHPTPHKLYQSVPPEISSCPPNVTKRIGATSLPQSNNNESRKLLVICSASEEHNTGDHQENALRTALICGPGGCLRREELKGNIEWINSDNLTPAPLADLLRVHEYTYLKYIDDKCQASAARTRGHQHQQPLPAFYAPPGMLDADTPLQPQSLEAAKRFCGAAILAVDHVMQGMSQRRKMGGEKKTKDKKGGACDRVFVIGRPPGHHAGPHGCVPSPYFWQRPDMASSGFCLLNTVAVAAAYARHQYGRWAWRNSTMQANPITRASSTQTQTEGEEAVGQAPELQFREHRAPRVAIVDIDVHHGNGTEEIVRNLTPRMVHLPLPSSWAPQSALSYKPWLNEQDAEEVFFSSVHLYAAERFYPCSGPDSFPEEDKTASPAAAAATAAPSGIEQNERIVNIALTPLGPGPWDRKARAKLTPAQRDLLCKQASAQFRAKVSAMLLPRIARFNPDLIFISAGFDAHFDDMYHFLTEQDLHWVTEELCAVAERSGGEDGAGCGVISVLEGGYSLSSPVVTKPVKVSRSAAVPPVATGASAPSMATAAFTGAVSGGEGSAGCATSSSEAAATATVLGRGGRQKAKKTTPHSMGVMIESPEGKASGAAVLSPSGSVLPVPPAAVKEEVRSPCATAVPAAVDVSATVLTVAPHAPAGPDLHSMYAQRPGDGGLVKGVLAHAAALVGLKAWSK